MGIPVGVNRIANANIYVDGLGLLGRAEEITIPDVKFKMVDHKGLGMFGTAEFPAGADKLEAKIKWASIYQEVSILMTPYVTHFFQVRGSIEQYTSQGRSAELPYVLLMTGLFKDGGDATFKQHENVDKTSALTIYHLEEYIDGLQTKLYDVLSNIWIVNGLDQLAQFTANIGG
ncbi:MAG: phage major tail tube protein [Bradyrhizobium sp.]|nr:phage major tail tube protein [Bradyrhizobium sp.]